MTASMYGSETRTTAPRWRSASSASVRCSSPAWAPAQTPAIPSCTIDGRVRHRPDDRHARGEVALDRRGRDRGRDREHRLLGLDQRADLAEQRLDVLRLDGDDDERGAGCGLGVRERDVDAVPLAQLVGALLRAGSRPRARPPSASRTRAAR